MLFKRPFFLFVCCLFITENLSAQFTISGSVVDAKNIILPYVSVYEEGTTNGTISNEEGNFTLTVSKGSKRIVFQQLGYKTKLEKIQVESDMNINIVLEEELVQLDEFVFKAGEDPAIPIIRKAIEKRSSYKNKNVNYEAELYIKGLIKLTDAPEKLFGRELGTLDGILDSSRQGILYLSESLSKIYVQSPDKYKEVMISSKVSGEDRSISANQFAYSNFNFYNEDIQLFRSIVSPLADNAFQFYNFYLYEEIIDKRGKKVFKIKVKPKSDYRPCLSGFIYINDDLFNFNAIDLSITGEALKNPIFDTITISQVFIPVSKEDDWRIFNQTIHFGVSFFAFNSKGTFSYVFKNYNDNPPLQEDFFNKEVFAVKETAIKNDTAFWNANRPVPLTLEESKDYIRKDSISQVVNSEVYRDSVDKKNNKFKIVDLLFGYDYRISKKKIYIGYNSPINSIAFNAVEGTVVSIKPYFTKLNEDGNNVLTARAGIRYGFSDHRVKYNVSTEWNYKIKSLSKLTFNFGSDYLQYYEQGIVSTFGNTFQSLIYKSNIAKYFKKNFAEIKWSSEIVNGLTLELGGQINNRSDLDNSSDFSWFNKSRKYEYNNPFNLSPDQFSLQDKQLKYTLQLRFAPGQKYQSYPGYRDRIPSDYPTLFLQMENAVPANDDYSDYLKLKFLIIDNYVRAKIFGHTRYRVEAGKFIYNRNSSIVDAFHFRGNNLISGFKSPYMQTFKLQEGYEFSSHKPYLAFWYEHHFDGYLFDKIPLLKKSGLTEIINLSSLIRDDIRYFEPGVGIEGFKLGAIDLMRLDYFWSFQNGEYKDRGFRIGFSMFFENILR